MWQVWEPGAGAAAPTRVGTEQTKQLVAIAGMGRANQIYVIGLGTIVIYSFADQFGHGLTDTSS